MLRLLKRLEIDSKEVGLIVKKEEDLREEVVESYVSVRRKEVKSGGTIWKG